jgi:hypothetical protein
MKALFIILTVLVLTIWSELASAGVLDNWTSCYKSSPAYHLGPVTYGSGQFVVVGTGVSETSVDGTNWVLHSTGPVSDGIDGVAFGNGKFAAVDFHGTLFSSLDGVTWDSHHWPTTAINNIYFGNGLFLALKVGSTLLTSTDAVNWVERPCGKQINEVAYGNGLFVGAADEGGIVESTNGKNWIESQLAPILYDVTGIAYGNGRFVVVSLYQGLMWSSDGVNWSTKDLGATLLHVCYGNGLFIALGFSNEGLSTDVYTSSDGENWQKRTTGTVDLSRVGFGHNQFIAVGNDGTVMSSTDGMAWNLRQPAMPSKLNGITYANGQFVAVGDYGTILTSYEGANWTQPKSGTQYGLTDLAYGGGQFVAVGWGSILTSLDTLNWGEPQLTEEALTAVSYGNGLFVAAGSVWDETIGGDRPSILTSTDGVTWAERQVDAPGQYLSATCYGNGQFIAVGSEGVVMTSTNGQSWVRRESGTEFWLSGVAYGNGQFVAVGGQYYRPLTYDFAFPSNAILTSVDGTNWIVRQAPTTNVLRGVAYGDGQFLAVGDAQTLLSSGNGVEWLLRRPAADYPYDRGSMSVTYGDRQFLRIEGLTGVAGIWKSARAGQPSGPLGLWLEAESTNVAVGDTILFSAWHTGAVTKVVWDFGDSTVVPDHPLATHAWSRPGTYIVHLIAYSDSYPAGTGVAEEITVRLPQLSINRYEDEVVLAWPANTAAFTLQSTASLDPPIIWSAVALAPIVTGGENRWTTKLPYREQYYRLSGSP